MGSTPIGGRPFPGFGYTGSMRAHSSRHGTTRSISARNCARRVVFVYFSKPVPTSVSCERLFISTSRSHVMWLAASQHNTRESGSLLQRFLSASPMVRSVDGGTAVPALIAVVLSWPFDKKPGLVLLIM